MGIPTEVVFSLLIAGLYLGLIFVIRDSRKQNQTFAKELANMEARYAGLEFDRSELSIAVKAFRSQISEEIRPVRQQITRQGQDISEMKGLLHDAVEKLASIRA